MKRARLLLALLVCGCVQKHLGNTAIEPQAAPQALAPTPVPTAAPVPAYPQSRPLDQAKPVKIKADKLRYNDRSKETQFLGHVVATQDTTILKADRLRSSNQGQSAQAEGSVSIEDTVRKVRLKASEGDYSDSLGEANLSGGVTLNSQDPYTVPVTVTGQRAWYRSLSRLARLSGGVRVERGKVTATAQSADMNGEEDVVALSGSVDMQMGQRNRVRSSKATMRGKDRSVSFEGGVDASLIPAELKEASSHPER